MNKKESQILYNCKNTIDSYDYKKMVKYFPKRLYFALILRGTFINLIVSIILGLINMNFFDFIISFTIIQIFLFIYNKINLEKISEKIFNNQLKRDLIDTEFETNFYSSYFIRKSKKSNLKLYYKDVLKCIETEDYFFVKYEEKNKIIIIKKSGCTLDLISFIREKFNNFENHLGEYSKFKGVKKYNNSEFIQKGMLVLFILTLLSLWGGLYTFGIIENIFDSKGFDIFKNTWVFWLWLPIPILSIILGFKFKEVGYKCTKNIIAGFIIGFLLLIYGSISLFPTFTEDYQKINNYKNIINLEIPDHGKLEIQNWGTYFDYDKTDYTIINVYYDKQDITKLINSLKESDNWIKGNDLKSSLKVFVPSTLVNDVDVYFSIYNKTLNEYNTLPNKSGEYEIYAMKFDISDKTLEIHKFNYAYKV